MGAAVIFQVDRHHEFDVRAICGCGVNLRLAVQVQAVQLALGAEHDHSVRIAHRDGQAGARGLQAAGGHQAVLASLAGGVTVDEAPGAHVDGVAFLGAGDGLHSGAGGNLHGLADLKLDQALGAQVLHEGAHAVTAHLGDGAVTVAVVHEPHGVGVFLEELLAAAGRGASGSANEAVRADTEVAVAGAGDQVGGEGNL